MQANSERRLNVGRNISRRTPVYKAALGLPKIDVIGFSMGGMLAQEFVFQNLVVRHVILAGAAPAISLL